MIHEFHRTGEGVQNLERGERKSEEGMVLCGLECGDMCPGEWETWRRQFV
jgi:hypothetical protein